MKEKLRYCIEYINPQCPTLQNGAMNIRHWRVETEKEADRAILLILSFGGKILSTYRGSVTQGRVSDWDAHLELEDKFSQEWFDGITKYDELSGSLSVAFMHFLDEGRPDGKMCLSNMECADIEKAFKEKDWAKVADYLIKYRRPEGCEYGCGGCCV